jgi:lipopolysaccharide export system protein LptC
MMNALRRVLDRLSLYLPAILMAVFALGSWWLVRSLPNFFNETAAPLVRHEPDYFLQIFSVKSFDSQGRLMRELSGEHAQHFPDTDTLDIQKVQLRGHSQEGQQVLLLQIRLWLKGTVRK